MSLTKSWYTVDEAASKFGVSPAQILKWVEDGLVRYEGKGKNLLIDGNDIAQELNLIPSV
jgi:DNA-binding transcriptional MerR regulator